MSEDRFQRLMRAIDPELLEEAQTPMKRRSYKSWAAAGVAACLCVAAAGIYAGQRDDSSATGGSPPQADAPTDASSMTALANPVHSVTEAELEKLGYTMVLPEGASAASYSVIDSGSGGVPLAPGGFFLSGGQLYPPRPEKRRICGHLRPVRRLGRGSGGSPASFLSNITARTAWAGSAGTMGKPNGVSVPVTVRMHRW